SQITGENSVEYAILYYMTRFKYKAVTAGGDVYEKVGEAESAQQLAQDLASRNETLVFAHPSTEKRWYQKLNVDFGRIKVTDRITFAKNLAAMVDAGLTVSRGVSIMEHQTSSKKFKDVLV